MRKEKINKEEQFKIIKDTLLKNKGLMSNTGVLKKGYKYLADKFGTTQASIKEVVDQIRRESRLKYNSEVAKKRYLANGGTKEKLEAIEAAVKTVRATNYNKIKDENRLVIGDLHAPFILPGYLEWCKKLQQEYNCNKVTFIGDVIDGHSWSYHESDVDGYSVGDELAAAKKQLLLAYELFPEAEITLGNHDLLIARKARTAGLSQYFIKDLGEILESPKDWIYSHEFIHNNVRYTHGTIGNAFRRAMLSRMSTVQGHLHSESFVQYSVSEKDAIFGLQVGCAIDRDKYAFEYGKPFPKKPVISAGLVLENGTIPLIRLMPL